MLLKRCLACLWFLKHKLLHRESRKWLIYLQNFCQLNAHKHGWCYMFIDNIDLIKQHQGLPEEFERQVRQNPVSLKMLAEDALSQGNIIKFLIDLFGSYVKLKYFDVVNPSQTTVCRLAEDYKEFVRLIQNIISLYYVLDDRHVQGEEPFRKGELLNFSVELVLKNEDLSETINKVLKNCFKESADRIHFNIRKFQHTPISCYGIPEEYQLSQDTLKHFNKAFRQGISDNVFTGSIQIVKQVTKVPTPADKQILIESIIKQIESIVTHFYQTHSITHDVRIDCKNMTALVLYVIVQASQCNLVYSVELVNNFSVCPATKHSEYAMKIMNECLLTLESGSLKKKDSPRKSFPFFQQNQQELIPYSPQNLFEDMSQL